MLRFVLLSVLVSAAAAGRGRVSVAPDVCVSQPCHPPDRCQQLEPDVSVCVRHPAPTCAAIFCPYNHECVLQTDTCRFRPCRPEPVCIPKGSNQCGLCIAPNEFCELRPESGSPPTCRHVIEPRCDNKQCPYGQQCVEEPLVCIRAPCGVQLVCRPVPPPSTSYGPPHRG